MCDIDDFEPCAVWSETRRRANKQHSCDGCGGNIMPGDEYIRHFSIAERDSRSSHTEKLCLPCDKVRDTFAKHHHSALCNPGSLYEFVDHCVYDGDEDSEKLWKPALAAMDERRQIASVAARHQ